MNRTAAVTIGTVLTALLVSAAACDSQASGDDSKSARSKKDDKNDNGGKAERAAAKADAKRGKFKLGRIDSKSISESSGLAASRKHPGVYWTHNDSGNGPYVFAIQQDGHFLAEFPVASARNTDWEAIAIDDQGRLFVADIGNNDLKRDRALVYRLDEPDPAAAPKGKGMALRVGQVIRLKYPAKPFDAESFFV